MTATTTLSSVDAGLSGLAFARGFTHKLIEGIPDDKLTHRAAPGSNHALWIMGHLAHSENSFCSKVSGNESVLPENYAKLFGMGSEPSDDASTYPSKAELLDSLDKARTALTDWLGGLNEDQLAAPLPEDYQMFGPNVASLASAIAYHEGVHAGQLIEIRRSLGLPRAMG